MDSERSRLIDAAAKRATFDGWTNAMLEDAAKDAGLSKTVLWKHFPGGAEDAVAAFIERADEAMLDAYGKARPTEKIRDRIITIIMLRLETLLPHREALRRAVAFYALPMHAYSGLKTLYRTVDAMWYGIGDRSSDFSFYTRRLSLAGIYSATVYVWLTDDTPDLATTRAFLTRRIDGFLSAMRHKAKLEEKLGGLFAHFTPRRNSP